ncbi:hypothetical protein D9M72_646270 [compost metagenome]
MTSLLTAPFVMALTTPPTQLRADTCAAEVSTMMSTDDAFTNAMAALPIARSSESELPCVMIAATSRPSVVRSTTSSLTDPRVKATTSPDS